MIHNQITNLNFSELIKLLYQNRAFLEILWAKYPKTLNRNEVLAYDEMTEVKLNELIAKNVLAVEGDRIALNGVIGKFLRDFLHQNKEVNIGAVEDRLKIIKRTVEYYRADEQVSHFEDIKPNLQELADLIIGQILKLQAFIEDTYKNEVYFETKVKKLENYRVDRNSILQLITEIETFLVENQGFFNLFKWNSIHSQEIVSYLEIALAKSKKQLFEIQDQVIKYINQIKYQIARAEHIRKLKAIKTKEGSLKYATNIKAVAIQNADIFWDTESLRFKTKVALSYLYDDEGIALTEKIKLKIKEKQGLGIREPSLKRNLKSQVEPKTVETRAHLNISSFITQFKKTDMDLLSFIMEYSFPPQLNFDFEKKLTLYMDILMDYDKVLNITPEFRYFFHKRQNLPEKIGYAVVYVLK